MESIINPHPAILKVFGAVMTYLGEGTSWEDIKRAVNDPSFKSRLIKFKVSDVKDETSVKIRSFIS